MDSLRADRTVFDARRDRVLAAEPCVLVGRDGGDVVLANPALSVTFRMSPEQAMAAAASLVRAAAAAAPQEV